MRQLGSLYSGRSGKSPAANAALKKLFSSGKQRALFRPTSAVGVTVCPCAARAASAVFATPPPYAARKSTGFPTGVAPVDRKSTRLNSSHSQISYAVFCLKKKKLQDHTVY